MRNGILILLVIILGAGCKSQRPQTHSDRPTVTVGLPPLATLMGAIAGDSLEVNTLLSESTNPETFELSVSDLKRVYDSDLYISSGVFPFEESLTRRLMQNGDIEVADCSAGIDLLYGTHEAHAGHDHDEDCAAADPHIWSSIPNLKIIAANMLYAAKQIAPAHAGYYTSNYTALVQHLDSIDGAFSHRLKGTEASFLIWHPSLSYFANDYGLQQIAIGAENKELTVGTLRDRISQAQATGVTTLFIQSNFDAGQSENLSRQLDLNVVAINPLDPDWESQLNIVTDAISPADTGR